MHVYIRNYNRSTNPLLAQIKLGNKCMNNKEVSLRLIK